MFAHINLPPGRPTKPSDEPVVDDTPTPQPSVNITTVKKKTRGKYKKEEKDSRYETAMAVGVKSMIETGGSIKDALAAIENEFSDLVASIPRSTLRSRYQKQLKIASQKETHEFDEDVEDDLDLFDRNNEEGRGGKGSKEIAKRAEGKGRTCAPIPNLLSACCIGSRSYVISYGATEGSNIETCLQSSWSEKKLEDGQSKSVPQGCYACFSYASYRYIRG